MDRSTAGFTLVEVTVLLAVVGLLVSLMAGSAGDALQHARTLRTREDVQQIGKAIASFYADNGFFPRTDDVRDGRSGTRLLGSLVSTAPLPDTTPSTGLWTESRFDLLSAHLTRNIPGYRVRDPLARLGWAGPYLTSEVEGDAWGLAYVVNVFYLDPRDILLDLDGTPLGAVYVLSAGPNGILETPYYQPRDNATIYGDDIGFRLQ